MKQEHARNTLIGIFVLAAICLCVFLVLFLHPRVGDQSQKLHVRFSNVERLEPGIIITFAGKPVGQIVSISQVPQARQGATDRSGRPYIFDVTFAIDSSVAVYDTDEIVVRTTGLFGERRVNIIPIQPPHGVASKRIQGKQDLLYAKSNDQIEELFAQLIDVAEKISCTFCRLSHLIEVNAQDITASIQSMKEMFQVIHRTFKDINRTDLVFSLKEAADRFTKVMKNIDEGVCQLNENNCWGNLSTSLYNFRLATESGICLAQELRELIDDVRSYGLLFHLNKRWQRKQRSLQCCYTPIDARYCLQAELQNALCALARMSRLIERTQQEEAYVLAEDPSFNQECNKLLSEINLIEERLQTLCCPSYD